jgi:diamine N-acetyltransferase
MTISLQNITKENFEAICDLEVTEEQEEYIAINAYSLAEAAYNEGYIVQAIYKSDQPIGFFMWVLAEASKVEIWRFMVDKKYQNLGIGRQALTLAVQKITLDPKIKIIEICYDPNNIIARNFYLSFGFKEIGMDADHEEMLAILTL